MTFEEPILSWSRDRRFAQVATGRAPRLIYRVSTTSFIDFARREAKLTGVVMILRASQFEFRFPRPALIMGILNVTPDSFYDGGRYFDLESAVARAREMIAEGADIVDVGGESTRPFATPVSEEEELRRVVPVIRKLASEVRIPISIDTQKTAVARAAVAAGATMVNDVGASRAEDAMLEVVARSGAAYVVMHSQGTPQTMQLHPAYADVVEDVGAFFSRSLARLAANGVRAEQIVLDVGIGFGKTVEHNLELIAKLRKFTDLGRPLLLGVSRKSFLGQTVRERLPGALACAAWGVEAGVGLVRVHDVEATRQAVRMTETLLTRRQP